MAQMETDGIEEAIRQLNKADLFTDENVKRMLTALAGVSFLQKGAARGHPGGDHPDRRRPGVGGAVRSG